MGPRSVSTVRYPLKSRASGHSSSADRGMLRGTLAWDDQSAAALLKGVRGNPGEKKSGQDISDPQGGLGEETVR